MLITVQNMIAQEAYLLAGTYTKGGSKGIYVYKFNTKTGDLKAVGTTFTENPSYLAISKDKKHVYAVNENGDNKGAVSAFSFDKATGKLTLINSQSSHGDHPCYISVDKTNKWVVAGNYTGGNFSVYPVKQDGSLGEAVQTIQHTGNSVNKSRQEKPHVHSVVFSPDEKFLAVTDLGTDRIMIYPFNPQKDKPVNEKAIEVKSKPGSGPRHIIFHPGHPFAYVIEELSGEVSAYRVKNGNLQHFQSVSTHPKNYKGDIGSAAIKLSKDSKFLYASNRGESNTIAVFALDPSSGKLTLKEIVNSGGKAPRDFTIDPSDNYLLSANASSDNVTIFKRNRKTGVLQETGKQESIPQPVCLVFF
jgi:6-phosphogluconolactonase